MITWGLGGLPLSLVIFDLCGSQVLRRESLADFDAVPYSKSPQSMWMVRTCHFIRLDFLVNPNGALENV
jgi:hypothetical protein